MKNKIGQYGLNTFYSILSIATFYYMCCLVLPLIHVNNDYLKKNKGIAIYITNFSGKSNIIMPVKNKFTNWEEHFNSIKFDSIQPNQKWLCFGFDEEDAYIENDSSFLSYLFLLPQYCGFGQSIIHVNYLNESAINKRKSLKIYLGTEQYLKLCNFIKESFETNQSDSLKPIIKLANYKNEMIFEAKQEFSFIYTSNTWTNSALKSFGYKTGIWTALEVGVKE
jgi:uncharacterized protein (TIGR02117 family)